MADGQAHVPGARSRILTVVTLRVQYAPTHAVSSTHVYRQVQVQVQVQVVACVDAFM